MNVRNAIASLLPAEARELDEEQRNQFVIVSVFAVVSVGLSLLFGPAWLARLPGLIGWTSLIFAGVLGVQYAWFRLGGNVRWFRLGIIITANAYIGFMVCLGGISNSGLLWPFVFCVLGYYVLGAKAGATVMVGTELFFVAVFFIPDCPLLVADYSGPLRNRFLLAFAFTGLCAFLTERSRERALAGRQRTIVELQEALQQIKTLTGLIPICAQCKKVRNDEGYFEQVEHFISTHTHASFTHTLCSECARDLYGHILPHLKI